jgi:L-rhamnose isomerase
LIEQIKHYQPSVQFPIEPYSLFLIMRIVFAAYEYTGEFDHPAQWLDRISAFTGILSALAKANEVHSIQQINFQGSHHFRRR